ncbi:MAG: hypothetical protein MRY83_20870 [Flavobacteriales bacterium]|nr:hypothetical protein [Flavobacteriales bacterium]
MKGNYLFCFLIFVVCCSLNTLGNFSDSIKINLDQPDSVLFKELDSLTQICGKTYSQGKMDHFQVIKCLQQIANVNRRYGRVKEEIACNLMMAQAMMSLKLYGDACLIFLRNKRLSKEHNYLEGLSFSNSKLGEVHLICSKYEEALVYFKEAIRIYDQIDPQPKMGTISTYLSRIQAWSKMGNAHVKKAAPDHDSALYCYNKSIHYLEEVNDSILPKFMYTAYTNRATLFRKMGDLSAAKEDCYKALQGLEKSGRKGLYQIGLCEMGFIHLKDQDFDSCFAYIQMVSEQSKEYKSFFLSKLLTDLKYQYYKTTNKLDLAISELERLNNYGDSAHKLYNAEQLQHSINMIHVEDRDQKIETLSSEVELAAQIRNKNLVLMLCLFGLLVFVIIGYVQFKKRKKMELIITEQKTRLQQLEIDRKNRELATQTMISAQKKELMDKIADEVLRLKSVNGDREIQDLDRHIRQFNNADKEWQSFKIHFEEVHPNFFSIIQSKTEMLTMSEQKMCAFIKMKLETKEIAQMLNINPTSVQKSRYRIKKKLGLGKEHDLIAYIQELG